MDIATIIGSFGFPICAAIGVALYVKYIIDAFRKDIKEMREEHLTETTKLSEALNGNTLVIQKLVDKLSKEDDNDED